MNNLTLLLPDLLLASRNLVGSLADIRSVAGSTLTDVTITARDREAIAKAAQALEAALSKVEAVVSEEQNERRRLEAAFAALTDDLEELPPVHTNPGTVAATVRPAPVVAPTPVVLSEPVATPPLPQPPLSVPVVAAPPVPPSAPARKEKKIKKSGKKTGRCPVCGKKKKCRCSRPG